MSIPNGEWDEYRETTTLVAPKVMRWPMAVPSLNVVPSIVVGVKSFAEPTTEPIVRGYATLLRRALQRDNLKPGGNEEEEFRLAQFDALNSLNARRSEVWIELDEQ